MSWVEHSERVIGDANEMLRLAAERESSLRGYLLTGNETLLSPYEQDDARLQAEIESLMKLVADNPSQVDTLRQIQAFQDTWNRYSSELIDLRRRNLDYRGALQADQGRRAFDATRREFGAFLDVELGGGPPPPPPAPGPPRAGGGGVPPAGPARARVGRPPPRGGGGAPPPPPRLGQEPDLDAGGHLPAVQRAGKRPAGLARPP
nr:CHASE3 domain-containing protein [Burkholderia glumae]